MVVRIDGPEDLLALATSIHDNFYPKSVMPDNPSMTACLFPLPSCIMREYVFGLRGKDYCRAPDCYIPDEVFQFSKDCPHRRYDAERSYSAQKSGPGRAGLPPIRLHSNRRERRMERLQRWVADELRNLTSTGCVAASVYLHDYDISLEWEEVLDLGERLWNSYDQLPRRAR